VAAINQPVCAVFLLGVVFGTVVLLVSNIILINISITVKNRLITQLTYGEFLYLEFRKSEGF